MVSEEKMFENIDGQTPDAGVTGILIAHLGAFGSGELKIDFRDENFKKIFLSETTWPRALIFGMQHHLVNLYQVCENYAPVAKNGPALGGHMFYKGLYKETWKKSSRLWYVSSPSGPLPSLFKLYPWGQKMAGVTYFTTSLYWGKMKKKILVWNHKT